MFSFLVTFGVVLFIIFFIQIKQYKKTEYYAVTHAPYFSVMLDAGRLGEYDTYQHLKSLKGYKKFLFNCYIPKEDEETTEIDVIMLHESGIYVFESKNYSGWIFGTENQKQWTQSLPAGRGRSKKEHIQNINEKYKKEEKAEIVLDVKEEKQEKEEQQEKQNAEVVAIVTERNEEIEKVCPRCQQKLVLRTAKKGENAGKEFWGCSSFPKCRYVEY